MRGMSDQEVQLRQTRITYLTEVGVIIAPDDSRAAEMTVELRHPNGKFYMTALTVCRGGVCEINDRALEAAGVTSGQLYKDVRVFLQDHTGRRDEDQRQGLEFLG